MAEPSDETLLDAVSVIVTAVMMTLDKLDKIADRVADIAVFTEAIYAENMRDVREREGLN